MGSFQQPLYSFSFNAGDRNRTGTVLLRQDFKSCASASSATPACKPRPPNTWFNEQNLMGGGGFEPPKQFAADLQSVPFGHSGIHPYESEKLLTRLEYSILHLFRQVIFYFSSIIISIPPKSHIILVYNRLETTILQSALMQFHMAIHSSLQVPLHGSCDIHS